MKISEVTSREMRGIGEDSLGSRPVDGGLSRPGQEPGAIRIGGKVVRRYDPRLLPDVLPLSSKRIRVNDRDAMLWKGMDVDGRTHVVWSYDLSSMSEDQDSYLQDPLDPEGDTDGPGRTGDQLDVGEGEVVQFKRSGIRQDAPNLQLAKSLASDLYWAQVGSHYTPEEEAYEREIEDRLAKIGYEAEWDLDAPKTTMVVTHMPTGRQIEMDQDELLRYADEHQLDEALDLNGIMRMANDAIRSIPGSAKMMANIKLAAKALSRIGAPLAILGALVSGVASADAQQRPQAITTANSTVQQFLKAYHAAKTEEERCRLANEWYGMKPPQDVCDISQHRMTTPDASKCQDVHVTRGANKGRTIRQCAEPEVLMPPRNESSGWQIDEEPALRYDMGADMDRAELKRLVAHYKKLLGPRKEGILDMWADGAKLSDIADEYGMSSANASDIIKKSMRMIRNRINQHVQGSASDLYGIGDPSQDAYARRHWYTRPHQIYADTKDNPELKVVKAGENKYIVVPRNDPRPAVVVDTDRTARMRVLKRLIDPISRRVRDLDHAAWSADREEEDDFRKRHGREPDYGQVARNSYYLRTKNKEYRRLRDQLTALRAEYDELSKSPTFSFADDGSAGG